MRVQDFVKKNVTTVNRDATGAQYHQVFGEYLW